MRFWEQSHRRCAGGPVPAGTKGCRSLAAAAGPPRGRKINSPPGGEYAKLLVLDMWMLLASLVLFAALSLDVHRHRTQMKKRREPPRAPQMRAGDMAVSGGCPHVNWGCRAAGRQGLVCPLAT